MLHFQHAAACLRRQVWMVLMTVVWATIHLSSSITTTPDPNSGTDVATGNLGEGCPRWEKSPWCPCYQFEDGLFLECPNTGLEEIRATLAQIAAPIKSMSIYHLDPNVTVLPDGLFENSTVYHLQISHTEIEIVQEHAFTGLELTLDSLSMVNSKLKEIPQGSLNKLVTLRTLDFDSNVIASVESYALYGLLITSLNLQNNQIELLTEYAFGGLENTLEELILINNRLKQFPLNSLRRLRNLKTLRLVWNEIEDIPDDGFTRFTGLQRVDLSSNKIRNLNERSFITMPRLTSLSLYMNRLTNLNDTVFLYLRELESLDVSHNSLTTVAGKAFSHLTKLRTIDLSSNHLHSINSGAFHNLSHLREIFLTNNIITKITNDTFYNTSQISVLFLPNNAITYIECGAFYHLHHLYQLQVSFNQLIDIHQSMFRNNRELRSLSLDNNLITELQPGTFQELVELRDLRLQNNLLKTIQKGVFYSLPNLQELHLQFNRIEMIEAEALQSLANLQHLNIQGNKMLEVDDILSRYPSSLRSLQLTHNEIVSMNANSLLGQNKLEILWLNFNKIKRLRPEVFRDLVEVTKLYLDHNKITAIEGNTFSGMRQLTYLNLEYNNLNHLNVDMFQGADQLEELYLSHNRIMDIEPQTFQILAKLKILHMPHNQIYVIRKYMFEGNLPLRELILSNIMAEEVDAGSFLELSSLQTLDISENKLNNVRVDFLFLPSLKHLYLAGNNLTGANENLFYGLSGLMTLNAENTGLNQATGRMFEQMTELRTIRLVGNNIKMLEPKHFTNLGFLKELYLDDNEIERIPTPAIERLTNLETFSISKNYISSIPNFAFRGNRNIKKLIISSNQIINIEQNAFANLTKVKELDLSNNTLKSLIIGVFDALKNLDKLVLDGNSFYYIPNTLLNAPFSNLRILSVNRNPTVRIREDLSITGHLKTLETLRINRGNITVIASHDFLSFRNIIHLSLRHNKIVKISPGAFKPLTKLGVLDLGFNNIDILPEERLYGLKKLKTLNLTSNRIVELPIFSEDIEQVEFLDVSGNQLQKVEGMTFRHLYNLKALFMQNNQITWIQPGAFLDLNSLIELNLESNKLTQINNNMLIPLEVRVSKLQLSGNPFQCDCDLLSFWEWIQDHARLIHNPDKENDDKELTCLLPEKLKDNLIYSLHPVDICPAPLIAGLEAIHLDHESLIVKWNIHNGTLIDEFLVTYHETSSREGGVTSSDPLDASLTRIQLEGLKTETWYTVCVTALGKYLRTLGKPIPYVTVEGKSNPAPPDNGNHKCLQVKTLAKMQKTKMTLSTLGIILGSSISAALVLTLSVLLTAIKFRRRRRRRPVKNDVPQEYISYRHFSLQSSEEPPRIINHCLEHAS